MTAQLLIRPAKKTSAVKRSLSALSIFFFAGALLLRGKATLPLDRSSLTSFHDWLNTLSAWIDNNRDSNALFTTFVNVIRNMSVSSICSSAQVVISK